MQTDSPIGQRWAVMAEALDERQRRLLAGVEAKVLGRGGISAVALATGVSRTTIMAGISEIEAMNSTDLPADQPATPKTTGTRQAGGGRKKIELKDETMPIRLRQVDLGLTGLDELRRTDFGRLVLLPVLRYLERYQTPPLARIGG